MPLLPAFEGDVGGATGNSIRAITNWNYASMCRYSILKVYHKSIDDII